MLALVQDIFQDEQNCIKEERNRSRAGTSQEREKIENTEYEKDREVC